MRAEFRVMMSFLLMYDIKKKNTNTQQTNKQTNNDNNNNNKKNKNKASVLLPYSHCNELINYFVFTLFIKQNGTHKIKVIKLQTTHGQYDGDEEYILSKS